MNLYLHIVADCVEVDTGRTNGRATEKVGFNQVLTFSDRIKSSSLLLRYLAAHSSVSKSRPSVTVRSPIVVQVLHVRPVVGAIEELRKERETPEWITTFSRTSSCPPALTSIGSRPYGLRDLRLHTPDRMRYSTDGIEGLCTLQWAVAALSQCLHFEKQGLGAHLRSMRCSTHGRKR